MDLVADPLVGVTETGLVTKNGSKFNLDIIVWATGFEVSETGVGLNHGVYGEDGKELRQTWKERKGAYGYLGVAVPAVRFLLFSPLKSGTDSFSNRSLTTSLSSAPTLSRNRGETPLTRTYALTCLFPSLEPS